MVLAYQDDEIDQALHDVIRDNDVGNSLEVPVPITNKQKEETIVAAAKVDAINQRAV
jgi:hypothetical protein